MPSRPPRPRRPARPRPTGRYTSAWQAIAREAIALEPWCHNPIGCPYPDAGHSTNPLTGDHIVPRSKGGRDELNNCRVLCRRCNSRRGNKD